VGVAQLEETIKRRLKGTIESLEWLPLRTKEKGKEPREKKACWELILHTKTDSRKKIRSFPTGWGTERRIWGGVIGPTPEAGRECTGSLEKYQAAILRLSQKGGRQVEERKGGKVRKR